MQPLLQLIDSTLCALQSLRRCNSGIHKMWIATFVTTSFCLGLVAGAALQCEPSRKPFNIEHETFCDKYYRCSNGEATEELCPDGLIFNIEKEICDLPYTAECGERTKLQEPRPTASCARQNGLFPVAGRCDQFNHCTDGIHSLITCPSGTIFSPSFGACVHPDQTNVENCSATKVLDFQCPNSGALFMNLRFGDHDRLAHPTSCRHFYMCLQTGQPRIGGCTFGEVFNPKSGSCDAPKNVPGCEDWYDRGAGEEGLDAEAPSQTPASTTTTTSAPNTTRRNRPSSTSSPQTRRTTTESVPVSTAASPTSTEADEEIDTVASSTVAPPQPTRRLPGGANRLFNRIRAPVTRSPTQREE